MRLDTCLRSEEAEQAVDKLLLSYHTRYICHIDLISSLTESGDLSRKARSRLGEQMLDSHHSSP